MLHTKTPDVRIDRLWVLHTMLLGISKDEEARSHFDLRSWIRNLYVGQDAAETDAVVVREQADGCVEVDPMSCGFAGCAIVRDSMCASEITSRPREGRRSCSISSRS